VTISTAGVEHRQRSNYSSTAIVLSIMRQDRIIGIDGDVLCKQAGQASQSSSIRPKPAITSCAPMMVVAIWAIDNLFCVACARINS
jgi:hypothetical protein